VTWRTHRRNDVFKRTAPRRDLSTSPSGSLKIFRVDIDLCDSEPQSAACVCLRRQTMWNGDLQTLGNEWRGQDLAMTAVSHAPVMRNT
jgi:hypothetical protein